MPEQPDLMFTIFAPMRPRTVFVTGRTDDLGGYDGEKTSIQRELDETGDDFMRESDEG